MPLRVEEMVEDEVDVGGLLELTAGLRLKSRYRSRARPAANASSCTSSDGTRLNVTLTSGKLFQERDHPVVVLQGVQPDPRQDVLACDQILVKGLVHVPEDCDLRHRCTLSAGRAGTAALPIHMFRILDRYVIREVLLPMGLSLVLLTFVVTVPTILRDAEALIVKGIPWATFIHVLVLLLPSSLSLTIPMSVLLGILIAFGRLSADREFVAMQACGVSPFRLIRPIAHRRSRCDCGNGATKSIVALPDANQTFREITFNVDRQSCGEQRQAPRVLRRVPQSNHLCQGHNPREAGARCFSLTRPSRTKRRCTSQRKAVCW